MSLLYLFATFFRIGLFAIGGGLATLPYLFELADKSSGWLSREMIGDMLAVSQSSPGAVGVNLSAYTGVRYAGISGAFAAALGLIAPSIIIIIIVARTLKAFKENAVVRSFMSGFKPAATALISVAGLGAISLSLWNSAARSLLYFIRWKEAFIFLAFFLFIFKFKKHPIIYIIAAGITGVALKL
jgi:chromate transporter